MTGYPSGTYNVFIDSTDDTTPLDVTTLTVTSGQLLLGSVTFNGSTLTASDATIRVKGVHPDKYVAHWDGEVTAGDLFVFPVERACWVENAECMVTSTHNTPAGTIAVDWHLGPDGSKGTTIFTTQTRRPIIDATDSAYTIAASGEPDGDRDPVAGEHLVAEVDSVFSAGSASNLTAVLHVRLT
jgi:hypothetical protein